MTWPKLPTSIHGLAGPIRILRPVRIADQQADHLGRETCADWDDEHRTIRVASRFRRDVAVHLLLHELVHAALDDAGIALKDSDQEEAVCQSVASAMMHVAEWLLAE